MLVGEVDPSVRLIVVCSIVEVKDFCQSVIDNNEVWRRHQTFRNTYSAEAISLRRGYRGNLHPDCAVELVILEIFNAGIGYDVYFIVWRNFETGPSRESRLQPRWKRRGRRRCRLCHDLFLHSYSNSFLPDRCPSGLLMCCRSLAHCC